MIKIPKNKTKNNMKLSNNFLSDRYSTKSNAVFLVIIASILAVNVFVVFSGSNASFSGKTASTIDLTLGNNVPISSGTPTPIFPDKDTYVDDGDPTSNFGGQDYIYIGDNFGDNQYGYIHFNFTEKPVSIAHAYLYFDPVILSETMNLSICLLSSSDTWDEYSITYVNRPTNVIDQIDTKISRTDGNWVEITKFLTDNSITDLNLLLNVSFSYETYMSFNSKEGASYLFPPIYLYFVEEGDSLDTSPDDYVAESNEIVVDRDTYIFSDQGNSNFGGLNSLYAGISLFGDVYISILHFTGIPTTTTKLDLMLEFYSIEKTSDIYFTIIDEASEKYWSEIELTWVNWPYGDPLDFTSSENVSFVKQVFGDGEITVDLSEWIGNASFDVIISTPLTLDDEVIAYSKESYSWVCVPKLIVDDQPIQTTSSDSQSESESQSDTSASISDSSDTANDSINGSENSIPGYDPYLVLIGIFIGFIYIFFKKPNKNQRTS